MNAECRMTQYLLSGSILLASLKHETFLGVSSEKKKKKKESTNWKFGLL
jgi:hypothetical protein